MIYIFALFVLSVAVFSLRKSRARDMRSVLGIKPNARPMAVPVDTRDAFWATYDAPTFTRRGLTLESVIAPAPESKKPRKAKPKFTKVDQNELASLFASMQQQGGFEQIA